MRFVLVFFGLLVLTSLVGCGSSRWTDTQRTATEQLLISDAMDRAVSQVDFCALAGKQVFLDSKPLASSVDSGYLISTLRQHMLASGCLLKDVRAEAEYIVEARSGGIGTDKHQMTLGIPAISVPSTPLSTSPVPSIPEIPFIKKTEQQAVTKLALFAYNAKTGRPIWQSGSTPITSNAKDIWVAGAGPFQQGTIYEGTRLAGEKISLKLDPLNRNNTEEDLPIADVTEKAFFREPPPVNKKIVNPKTASSLVEDGAAKKNTRVVAAANIQKRTATTDLSKSPAQKLTNPWSFDENRQPARPTSQKPLWSPVPFSISDIEQ
jgi:Family of unknown function (DUF6655)